MTLKKFAGAVAIVVVALLVLRGEASATAELVRAALETAGVAKDDIATQNISVYPEYASSSTGTQTLSGYRAQQVFTVTLRDTAKAGEVVDSVIAAGGNALQVYGVTPTLLNTDAAVAQARKAAIKSAKEKAKDYAGLVDEDLGSVMYITEITSPSSPVPLMAGDAGSAEMSMTKTVVNLGTQEVSVTVEVRWSLDN